MEAEDFLFCVCSNELPLQFLCSRVYSEREDVGLSLMSSALHCVPPGEGLLHLCPAGCPGGDGAEFPVAFIICWILSPSHLCIFPLQPSKRGTSAGGSPTSAQMPIFTEFASSFVLGPPLNAAGQAEHGWGAAAGLGRDGAAVGPLLQQRR